jgi:peptidoglycan/xylan/chitin deacetylase (PgdA/CDA1 family)
MGRQRVGVRRAREALVVTALLAVLLMLAPTTATPAEHSATSTPGTATGQPAGPPSARPVVLLSPGRATRARHQASPPRRRTPTKTVDPATVRQRIERCWGRGPQVWLSFDDVGSPAQVHRILRVLAAARVRALFFPIGSWAKAHPGLVAEIGAAGHLVGNHTQDHRDLGRASEAQALWQIRHGDSRVPGAVRLLRPPFGDGAYTARVRRYAAETGERLCTWTVDTRDWAGAPAATIVRRVRRGDAITPPVRAGGVVLMHLNGDHTGAALPGVIAAVRARGLTLHRLG